MPVRRDSVVRYELECTHIPVPSRVPLRVPIDFDYYAVLSNAERVMAWMISKTTGGRGQLALGPQLRYLSANGDAPATYELRTADGARVLSGVDEERRAIRGFMDATRAPLMSSKRLGIATLRWKVNGNRHRSVLLCDARNPQKFSVFLVDPNGALVDSIKRPVMEMIGHYFRLQTAVPVSATFLASDSINVSPSGVSNWLDRHVYGLSANSHEPGGYCIAVSLLLINDVLCAKDRVLSKGHLRRLNDDLSGGAVDEGARRYNRLMALRSFLYELATNMQRDGELQEMRVPTDVILYVPVANLPPTPVAQLQMQMVGALRQMCRAHGVDDRGTKEELVLRLADVVAVQ